MGLTIKLTNGEWFRQNMGRGGAIPLRPRPAPEQKSSSEGNPIAESDTQQEATEESRRNQDAIRRRMEQTFSEHSPATIDQD